MKAWPNARVWSLGALLVGSAACGSSPSGPGPSPSPTPTPTPTPTRTVLVSRSFGLAGGATSSDTVDNVPAGVVDARVDWPGGSDVNLYVTDTSCPGRVELLGGQCRVFGQAVGTSKPERVQFTAAGTANYVYWLHNLGSSGETVSFEFGVTR